MENVRTKVFLSITDKDKTDRVLKLFRRHKITYSCSINGKGTASGSVMSYFGLSEIKKDVIISVVPEFLETKVLFDLHNKLEMYEPGNGICFSLPITSASRYLSNQYKDLTVIKEEYIVKNEKEYELIVLIVSEGYAQVAMDAAKKVGAGGGTLINGIGLGSKEATKFLGITIEPEKDVVLILVEKEEKRKIMEEISNVVGLSHEGRGICFAIPVDNVIGLSQNVEFLKK
ncbi:MAG: hypothetical protein IKO78_04955 [Bacilli bacterium]|nr:hypothetical protein [Bacilli bacterium]